MCQPSEQPGNTVVMAFPIPTSLLLWDCLLVLFLALLFVAAVAARL